MEGLVAAYAGSAGEGSQQLLNLYHLYKVFPLLNQTQLMTVSVCEKSNTNEGIPALRRALGKAIATVVWEEEKLLKALTSLRLSKTTGSKQGLLGSTTKLETVIVSDDEHGSCNFFNELLQKAMLAGTSDIHLDPRLDTYKVRFRIDGLLKTIHTASKEAIKKVIIRLKVLAQLHMAQTRLPQDGGLAVIHPSLGNISLRLSTMPTRFGEKMVLRILHAMSETFSLSELAMDTHTQEYYQRALAQPQGLIIVTGPTGSGKSTTLYAGLQHINSEAINVCTAEDPIEIAFPGINQVQVDPEIGLSFATVLRAFLRQDPDVIMIGEIRDHDTIQMVATAVQTGHLVLSTLHTHCAPSALIRLVQLGIPPSLLTGGTSIIIAQRLLRTLCKQCRRSRIANAKECQWFALKKSQTVYDAVGCAQCQSGYKGRIGIYETLSIMPMMCELDFNSAGIKERIKKLAIEDGMFPLQSSARDAALQGLTSFSEIERTLGSHELPL